MLVLSFRHAMLCFGLDISEEAPVQVSPFPHRFVGLPCNLEFECGRRVWTTPGPLFLGGCSLGGGWLKDKYDLWSTCQISSERSLQSLPFSWKNNFFVVAKKGQPKEKFLNKCDPNYICSFELLLSEVWTLVEGKLPTAQWSHGWWLLAIPALYGAVDAAGPGQWGSHGEGGNASFNWCWWGLFHSVLWDHGQKRISNQFSKL